MFKRGQAEAVGLLVLVILLLLVGFLYLRFSLRDSGKDYASVRESLAVHGLLRSLLQLEVGGERFEELIAGCYSDAGQCYTLRQRVLGIFPAVLEGGQEYRLVLKGEERTLLEEGQCRQGIVSRIPFTLEGVVYEGILTLCRRA